MDRKSKSLKENCQLFLQFSYRNLYKRKITVPNLLELNQTVVKYVGNILKIGERNKICIDHEQCGVSVHMYQEFLM